MSSSTSSYIDNHTGRLRKDLHLFETIGSSSPSDARLCFYHATTLFNVGKYEKALKKFAERVEDKWLKDADLYAERQYSVYQMALCDLKLRSLYDSDSKAIEYCWRSVLLAVTLQSEQQLNNRCDPLMQLFHMYTELKQYLMAQMCREFLVDILSNEEKSQSISRVSTFFQRIAVGLLQVHALPMYSMIGLVKEQQALWIQLYLSDTDTWQHKVCTLLRLYSDTAKYTIRCFHGERLTLIQQCLDFFPLSLCTHLIALYIDD